MRWHRLAAPIVALAAGLMLITIAAVRAQEAESDQERISEALSALDEHQDCDSAIAVLRGASATEKSTIEWLVLEGRAHECKATLAELEKARYYYRIVVDRWHDPAAEKKVGDIDYEIHQLEKNQPHPPKPAPASSASTVSVVNPQLENLTSETEQCAQANDEGKITLCASAFGDWAGLESGGSARMDVHYVAELNEAENLAYLAIASESLHRRSTEVNCRVAAEAVTLLRDVIANSPQLKTEGQEVLAEVHPALLGLRLVDQ